jgi:hypothetical protein
MPALSDSLRGAWPAPLPPPIRLRAIARAQAAYWGILSKRRRSRSKSSGTSAADSGVIARGSPHPRSNSTAILILLHASLPKLTVEPTWAGWLLIAQGHYEFAIREQNDKRTRRQPKTAARRAMRQASFRTQARACAHPALNSSHMYPQLNSHSGGSSASVTFVTLRRDL